MPKGRFRPLKRLSQPWSYIHMLGFQMVNKGGIYQYHTRVQTQNLTNNNQQDRNQSCKTPILSPTKSRNKVLTNSNTKQDYMINNLSNVP
ncbi:hypothetical protein HanIR_Chr12g0561581 [Helianthus annuus]|nr:hypothetical protein HanIR_Chr12g0561581 [Helianthus annuus]